MTLPLSRRGALKAGGALALAPLLPFRALAQTAGPRHGMSVFGDLKYAADFTHFDYVNPDAPKGGRIDLHGRRHWFFNQNVQTFNTLNSYVRPRRRAAPDRAHLRLADGGGDRRADIALRSRRRDGGRSPTTATSFTFNLRDEARFHDGTPLTAEDVAWSLHDAQGEGQRRHPRPLIDMESVGGAGRARRWS